MTLATDTLTRPTLSRVVWSSIIGTADEWYDFLLYATATALVFNKLFFPSGGDSALSTVIAFGTYGVGFFARRSAPRCSGTSGIVSGARRCWPPRWSSWVSAPS